MADVKELRNPFVKTKAHHRMFGALQEGPKRGEELMDLKIAKSIRQLGSIAARINSIHGVRIRTTGDMENPKTIWEMSVSDPACILLESKAQAIFGQVPLAPLPTLKTGPAKMGIYIPPEDYKFFRDSADLGDNIFLVGPTGSGKTEMATHGAKDLDRVFFRQNFKGETTVDNLIGYNEIKAEGDVSVTTWHDGLFAKACRLAAKGTKVLYCADEVTAGRPEVLFEFHRPLELKPDGSREVEINDEVIIIPAGMLSIVGCSNSFRADETGMFQGTQTMNAAFSNRWTGGIFFIDYAPNEHEIMQNHGIPAAIALALQAFGKEVRTQAKAEGVPVICSTRQLISIGKKAQRWGCKKAVAYCYLNTLTSDEYERVVSKCLKVVTWPTK